MKNFNEKVAVITGAGSGLGRSLALQLAEQGAHLALCDLNQAGLDKTLSLLGETTTRVSLHQVDVGDHEQMQRFAREVLEQHHQVDVLINNAGITLMPAQFGGISDVDFEKIVQVNFWGTYYGIREFLPHLETRPESSIVNVSSLAGLVGLYGYAPYSVSKFAVRALAEVLQSELGDSNVSVMVVHPGGIKTNLIKHAPDLADTQRETSHQVFTKYAYMTAEKVAGKTLKGMQRKKKRLILGVDAKIVYAIRILFPRRYMHVVRSVFSMMSFQ